MIVAFKTLHIAALVVWCAGLLALPILLSLHRTLLKEGDAAVQNNYTRFRRVTHGTYTLIATPAAIVAIAAGTVLIFAAQVFEMWLLVKLALVAGMVLAHTWLGHLIVQSSEKALTWRMPWPVLSLFVALPCMAGVLWMVLAKPDLTELAQQLPAFLQVPLELDATVWQWLKLDQEALP